MDKQNTSPTNNKMSNSNIPKQSIFSKQNFYKQSQNLNTGKILVPKFDKTAIPKTNVIVTQHKGGS